MKSKHEKTILIRDKLESEHCNNKVDQSIDY